MNCCKNEDTKIVAKAQIIQVVQLHVPVVLKRRAVLLVNGWLPVVNINYLIISFLFMSYIFNLMKRSLPKP